MVALNGATGRINTLEWSQLFKKLANYEKFKSKNTPQKIINDLPLSFVKFKGVGNS